MSSESSPGFVIPMSCRSFGVKPKRLPDFNIVSEASPRQLGRMVLHQPAIPTRDQRTNGPVVVTFCPVWCCI
jgi:hypothetical protein